MPQRPGCLKGSLCGNAQQTPAQILWPELDLILSEPVRGSEDLPWLQARGSSPGNERVCRGLPSLSYWSD